MARALAHLHPADTGKGLMGMGGGATHLGLPMCRTHLNETEFPKFLVVEGE